MLYRYVSMYKCERNWLKNSLVSLDILSTKVGFMDPGNRCDDSFCEVSVVTRFVKNYYYIWGGGY